MPVEGLSHITLIVADLARTARLLADVLGARQIYSSGNRMFSTAPEMFFDVGGVWLAIMEGDPWGGSTPRLLEVRPLASPTSNFSGVADACIVQILAKRDEAKE
jgi:catechol 2,3-dioxygenase-like lactoylglutathione lyase family enzyme